MAFLLGLLYFNALLGVIARRSIARRTDFHEHPVSVVSDIDAFTGNLQAPSQSMVQNTHKRDQQTNKFISATWNNRFFIICPFLGTLVNERVLPVKQKYSKNELQEVTMKSGLRFLDAKEHVDGNFKYTVFTGNSQFQDIFNLEGATNEHKMSTGINDCPTSGMFNLNGTCRKVGGTFHCPGNTTGNKNCGIPSASKFNNMFSVFDTNNNGYIEAPELAEGAIIQHVFVTKRLKLADRNVFGEGTISGAFNLILKIFGEEPAFISRDKLRKVFIERKFPRNFRWPGGYGLRQQRTPVRVKSVVQFGSYSTFRR